MPSWPELSELRYDRRVTSSQPDFGYYNFLNISDWQLCCNLNFAVQRFCDDINFESLALLLRDEDVPQGLK